MAKSRRTSRRKPAPVKPQPAPPTPQPVQRGLYTRELATRICERLANKESLKSICRDAGMPSEALVRSWVIDNIDGFAARHTRAREIQAMAWAEEILEIADDKQLEGDHRRSMVDIRKWLLSKVLRKVYGEKLELSGQDGGPIKLSVDERAARVRAVLEALQHPAKGKAGK